MKKIFTCCFIVCFCAIFGGIFSSVTFAKEDISLNLGQSLMMYFQSMGDAIGSDYKTIDLTVQAKYQKLTPDSMLYDTLQRAVYLGFLKNRYSEIDLKQQVSQWAMMVLLHYNDEEIRLAYTKNAPVTISWMLDLIKQRDTQYLMKDISDTLQQEYLIPEKIPDWKQYTGVQRFLEELDDPYTVYFPPTDAKDFTDAIYGEFVGIGAYIDMEKPWVLKIVKPIKNSPAEKAGLHIGDRVVAIDGKKVTEAMSVTDASHLIKWKEGTKVILSIQRDGKDAKIFDVEIVREKIILEYVSTEVFEWWDCYIDIDMFSVGVYSDFSRAVKKLAHIWWVWWNCKRYIFDVRGNPWGSLQDVLKIWNFFVPKWEKVLTVSTNNSDEKYHATASLYDEYFTWTSLIVLIDEHSASASEIFAGMIRSYHPRSTKIIGKTSFGKWTVQALKNYVNGWLLKYTIAQWLIWREQLSIDKKGITPDIEISDDPKTEQDEVLEWVKHNT